jgi:hypothetical protein
MKGLGCLSNHLRTANGMIVMVLEFDSTETRLTEASRHAKWEPQALSKRDCTMRASSKLVAPFVCEQYCSTKRRHKGKLVVVHVANDIRNSCPAIQTIPLTFRYPLQSLISDLLSGLVFMHASHIDQWFLWGTSSWECRVPHRIPHFCFLGWFSGCFSHLSSPSKR